MSHSEPTDGEPRPLAGASPTSHPGAASRRHASIERLGVGVKLPTWNLTCMSPRAGDSARVR